MKTLKLQNFDVSQECGFLPTVPAASVQLPEAFLELQQTATVLPKLLTTGKIRRAIANLPEVNLERETLDAMQLRRLMQVYSYLTQVYVWGERTSIKVLPRNIAVPFECIAQKLGRPPILSYASYILDNWIRLDESKPIIIGNIIPVQNFLGGLDEDWFMLIHIEIEARAAPALAVIPLILPQGLIYEGVEAYEGKPQQFRGETGSQSAIVPTMDALFNIAHANDPLRAYLLEMRDYMPPQHRAFVTFVEQHSQLREFIVNKMSHLPKLTDLYNECLSLIQQFRTTHLEFAARYIQQQTVAAHNDTSIGTGGTPFMQYLQKHRDETSQHLLKPNGRNFSSTTAQNGGS